MQPKRRENLSLRTRPYLFGTSWSLEVTPQRCAFIPTLQIRSCPLLMYSLTRLKDHNAAGARATVVEPTGPCWQIHTTKRVACPKMRRRRNVEQRRNRKKREVKPRWRWRLRQQAASGGEIPPCPRRQNPRWRSHRSGSHKIGACKIHPRRRRGRAGGHVIIPWTIHPRWRRGRTGGHDISPGTIHPRWRNQRPVGEELSGAAIHE